MFKTRLGYLWFGEKKLELLLAGLFYVGAITGALADLWNFMLLFLFQIAGIIWQLASVPTSLPTKRLILAELYGDVTYG